jgi:cob(I)alamin adenosyltransferase
VLALEGQYDAKTLVSGQDSIAQSIAAMNAELLPLTEFVIPGGSIAAAHSHLCRTVCRRSETDLWAVLDGNTELENEEAIDNLRNAGVYLNRLSDYFFVLARTLMIDSEEPQWRGPQKGA